MVSDVGRFILTVGLFVAFGAVDKPGLRTAHALCFAYAITKSFRSKLQESPLPPVYYLQHFTAKYSTFPIDV